MLGSLITVWYQVVLGVLAVVRNIPQKNRLRFVFHVHQWKLKAWLHPTGVWRFCECPSAAGHQQGTRQQQGCVGTVVWAVTLWGGSGEAPSCSTPGSRHCSGICSRPLGFGLLPGRAGGLADQGRAVRVFAGFRWLPSTSASRNEQQLCRGGCRVTPRCWHLNTTAGNDAHTLNHSELQLNRCDCLRRWECLQRPVWN